MTTPPDIARTAATQTQVLALELSITESTQKEIIQKHLVAMLAMERERCFREAAEIAEIAPPIKKVVHEERWITMTDDYGEPIAQMKDGPRYRINYREGIVSALLEKAGQPSPPEGGGG